jgi:hypothetical protein
MRGHCDWKESEHHTLKGHRMVDERESILPFGSFLFPRICQAFRMSIQPTKLVLALLALAVICAAGLVMDVSQSVVISPSGITELDEYIDTNGQIEEHIQLFAGEDALRAGVFEALWAFGSAQFHDALEALINFETSAVLNSVANCFRALGWAFTYHPIYSAVFFAIVLVVMSLAGASVCRIAALQFSRGERPGLTEAFRFGRRKLISSLTAPLTPLAIIAVIGVSIVLLGLIGNIGVLGELALGLFLPFALFAAAFIAVLAIGTVAGFNLMFPVIAYEDSDCFDAISRSFSYVYAKPWRMALYTTVAIIHGAICYLFVRFFLFLVMWITYGFLQLGFLKGDVKLAEMWSEPVFRHLMGVGSPDPQTWSMSAGAFLVHLWGLVVVGLLASFIISFYFCANTIICALMRNQVDRTPLDEVYRADDSMEGISSLAQSGPMTETLPSTEEDSPPPKSTTSE